jgi:hypothetical protein
MTRFRTSATVSGLARPSGTWPVSLAFQRRLEIVHVIAFK